jgi:23S rRNA pseudouridine2605 synthase
MVQKRKTSKKKTISKVRPKTQSRPKAKATVKRIAKAKAPAGKQRLQKVLAAAGIDSRRNCEELILEGRVRVNRTVVDELPIFVNPEKDVITVDGKRIQEAEKVYFLLNKPKSVICTNSDPQRRKLAIDLIDTDVRIFTVGRLDFDTTGAIILTNDSALANRLTHPRYELSKTYEVTVRERIEPGSLEKLKKGIWLSEGKTGRSAIKIIRRASSGSIIQMTIQQGLNRQVRRMFASIGYKVKALKRSQIGNLTLKGIGVGSYKKLTKSQVAYLYKATDLK